MKILLLILGVLLVISVVGFVIETLFWVGVVAAGVFVAVAVAGALKGNNSSRALR